MDGEILTIALISDVFYSDDSQNRLIDRLVTAKKMGADVAVLPELPLNDWVPATKDQRDEDAEGPNGKRCQLQCAAACEVGIGLIGGAIVRDTSTNCRFNTALIIDSTGQLVATYQKTHLPQEPGFWETSHYEPGNCPPTLIRNFGTPLGIQICSDANRPEGSHILAALGAEAIIIPRATELKTIERWKVVFQANAITSCAYILSVSRPKPEYDVLIGGPSIAVSPNGQVVLETTDPIGIVRIDRAMIRQARSEYPGYLQVRAAEYAAGWHAVVKERAES